MKKETKSQYVYQEEKTGEASFPQSKSGATYLTYMYDGMGAGLTGLGRTVGAAAHAFDARCIYWGTRGGAAAMWFGRGGGCCWLGVCAVALGLGILIAAIFPVGCLLFIVALLLIACGSACLRR